MSSRFWLLSEPLIFGRLSIRELRWRMTSNNSWSGTETLQFCFCKNPILGRRSYCKPSPRGPLADILTEAAQRHDYLHDARKVSRICAESWAVPGAITFDIGTLLALRHSLCMPQHKTQIVPELSGSSRRASVEKLMPQRRPPIITQRSRGFATALKS